MNVGKRYFRGAGKARAGLLAYRWIGSANLGYDKCVAIEVQRPMFGRQKTSESNSWNDSVLSRLGYQRSSCRILKSPAQAETQIRPFLLKH